VIAVLKDIDFSPGSITFNQINDLYDEDLLQVCYGDDLYIIDVGWYRTEFAVLVIIRLDQPDLGKKMYRFR